jgi:hypothetical protein
MNIRNLVNSILDKILTLFGKTTASQRDYQKYLEYVAELNEIIPNIEDRAKYIKLEAPEPSKQFIIALSGKIFTVFGKNQFTNICYLITPLKVKKALKQYFEENSYLLEKNTLAIFQRGWDINEGKAYLNEDGYLLWSIFNQIAINLGYSIPEFKYGRESYQQYVEHASNNVIKN